MARQAASSSKMHRSWGRAQWRSSLSPWATGRWPISSGLKYSTTTSMFSLWSHYSINFNWRVIPECKKVPTRQPSPAILLCQFQHQRPDHFLQSLKLSGRQKTTRLPCSKTRKPTRWHHSCSLSEVFDVWSFRRAHFGVNLNSNSRARPYGSELIPTYTS